MCQAGVTGVPSVSDASGVSGVTGVSDMTGGALSVICRIGSSGVRAVVCERERWGEGGGRGGEEFTCWPGPLSCCAS